LQTHLHPCKLCDRRSVESDVGCRIHSKNSVTKVHNILPNICHVCHFIRMYPLLGNGGVFYGSASRLYKWFRTESNTSSVTLRVVGGDEKGSLKTETVKYGREIQGTRTRERLLWRGPAAYTKDRPVLPSERAPHKNKTVTVKQ
jgi:hypothetical protein